MRMIVDERVIGGYRHERRVLQEIRMLQEPITVATQHLHQFLLLFVVLIPLANRVE